MKQVFLLVGLLLLSMTLVACDPTDNNPSGSYQIEFDTDGGSSVEQMSVENGSSLDLPTPTKEGHSFLGWVNGQTSISELMTGSFTPTSSVTLYAVWEINEYTISFVPNGGTDVTDITADFGTSITEPTEPFKNGFTFEGWYIDSEFTTMFSFSTMPGENMSVYAKWEPIDWSSVEEYLSSQIPEVVDQHINLPTTYLNYGIRWESSNLEAFTNTGRYTRPYQPETITLTATISQEEHTTSKVFTIALEGYKSLTAPILSSYMYRDYYRVDDSFFTTLDIINCAFIHADENGDLSGTSVLNNISIYIMPKAKQEGNWVLFSVAPDSEWSSIAISPTKINNFADNIVEMINTYGFDGVDIDWETPDPGEEARFTEMMRVIYTKVKENNPNHLVTAAIAGGMWQPPRYDLVNSQQYLDYINMMTYGMVSNNGYYQNALSRSTVFDDPANVAGKTLTSCSIEESVAIYHNYGIPNSKIIVGVAFYGIMQTRTYNSSTGTWSSWTNAGSVSYSSIVNNYLTNNDYDTYYDTAAGVPYIMKKDGSVFISFDNPRSIADKSEYIIEQGLAGMMYWENGLDPTGTLLNAMQAGLEE